MSKIYFDTTPLFFQPVRAPVLADFFSLKNPLLSDIIKVKK